MILDEMTANPAKYEGKKLSELTDEEEFDEDNSVEHGKVYYKKSLLPKLTLVIIVHFPCCTAVDLQNIT